MSSHPFRTDSVSVWGETFREPSTCTWNVRNSPFQSCGTELIIPEMIQEYSFMATQRNLLSTNYTCTLGMEMFGLFFLSFFFNLFLHKYNEIYRRCVFHSPTHSLKVNWTFSVTAIWLPSITSGHSVKLPTCAIILVFKKTGILEHLGI